MSLHCKAAGTYQAGTLFVKTNAAYEEQAAFLKIAGGYAEATGTPPPTPDPSLDFSVAANSQYLALMSVGGM